MIVNNPRIAPYARYLSRKIPAKRNVVLDFP